MVKSCTTEAYSQRVPYKDRIRVIATLAIIQNGRRENGLKDPCVPRIDCPHCGHQKLIDKQGAGDFDLYCYGEWIPISIETII